MQRGLKVTSASTIASTLFRFVSMQRGLKVIVDWDVGLRLSFCLNAKRIERLWADLGRGNSSPFVSMQRGLKVSFDSSWVIQTPSRLNAKRIESFLVGASEGKTSRSQCKEDWKLNTTFHWHKFFRYRLNAKRIESWGSKVGIWQDSEVSMQRGLKVQKRVASPASTPCLNAKRIESSSSDPSDPELWICLNAKRIESWAQRWERSKGDKGVSMQRGLKVVDEQHGEEDLLLVSMQRGLKARICNLCTCCLHHVSMQRGLKELELSPFLYRWCNCLNAKRIESWAGLPFISLRGIGSQCKEDWKHCYFYSRFALFWWSQCKEDWKM